MTGQLIGSDLSGLKTATETPLPPTATNTPLPPPTNTVAPATSAVQSTPVPATATSAPPSASGNPAITGVSLISREPKAITVSISFSGLQPNQKYNVIAFAPDCPANCGRYGIIHSGLFNYFTPTSGDWVVQLRVGIDSIFCDGGNSTTSYSLTVDLAVGVSFGPDYTATFPLPNTWCTP